MRNTGDALAQGAGMPGQQVIHELWDVIAAGPQRRQGNRHHIQAIEQVFPKPAGFNFPDEVLVGRSQNPCFDGYGLVRSHRQDFLLLYGAKSFACVAIDISAISSRNTVPLPA